MVTHPHNRCRVVFIGRGCKHDLCYVVDRGVPPELRCSPAEPPGYVNYGGSCCTLPPDMDNRVEHALRFNLQECKRLGYVPIAA